MNSRMKTINWGLNKEFGSKFPKGYKIQQTLEEVQRLQWLKGFNYNNLDENNSSNKSININYKKT